MADVVRFVWMAALSLALGCPRTPAEPAQASPSTESSAPGASAAPAGTLPPAPPPPPPSGVALIKEREGAMRRCYPKSVTGTVVLTWRVGEDGRAVHVQVFPMKPELRDEKAEACLTTIVERTAFLPKHAAAYQYRLRL